MSYKEKFDRYREINLRIIDSIKGDKEDLTLFEKREEVINEIFSLNLDKSQIRKIYVNEKLDILDNELEYILKEKMASIKIAIKEIKLKKQANLGYATANRGSNLFSERV